MFFHDSAFCSDIKPELKNMIKVLKLLSIDLYGIGWSLILTFFGYKSWRVIILKNQRQNLSINRYQKIRKRSTVHIYIYILQ